MVRKVARKRRRKKGSHTRKPGRHCLASDTATEYLRGVAEYQKSEGKWLGFSLPFLPPSKMPHL